MARDNEYRSDEYDRDYERGRQERGERDDRWERNRDYGEFTGTGEHSRRQSAWYRGGSGEQDFDEGWQRRGNRGAGFTRNDPRSRGYSGRGRDWSEQRDYGARGGEDYGGYSNAPWSGRYDQREQRDRFGDERMWGGYGGYESGLGAYGPSTGFGYGPTANYIGQQSMWRGNEGRRENFVGRGPRGYRRSDERIREDVNERLTRHPDLDATDVDVRVENCTITLTGVVEDRRAKRLAEDIAEEVWGAEDVRNELKIRHGFLASLTGEQADERDVTRPAVRDTTDSTRKATARTGTSTTGSAGITTE
ncbi:MAG TPA: BON domain-containing protein [Gemmatimonadaceae bacterium]|nr:BON domain-containing protein [Gemmatimonadaceae bacterium]